MPITFYTKPAYNLIILRHKGKITDEEFFVFYKQLFKTEEFNLSMNLLIDLREADSRSRSSDTLQHFADFVRDRFKELTAHPKVAVIAQKDLSFGLARMYQSFAGSVPWEFTVFRAPDAALAWLGVPEDMLNSNNYEVERETEPGE